LVREDAPGFVSFTGLEAGATIELDGVLVGAAPLTGPMTAPPGQHSLIVRMAGRLPSTHAIQVVRTETVTVDVKLEPVVEAGPIVTITEEPDGFEFPVGAWTALGVGLGAGAAGLTVNFLATKDAEDARLISNTGGSGEEWNAAVDKANDKLLIANVLYATAGVGALTAGVWLLVANLRGDDDETDATTPTSLLTPTPHGAAWTLRF